MARQNIIQGNAGTSIIEQCRVELESGEAARAGISENW